VTIEVRNWGDKVWTKRCGSNLIGISEANDEEKKTYLSRKGVNNAESMDIVSTRTVEANRSEVVKMSENKLIGARAYSPGKREN
jgi:hypothetical protein